MRCCKTQGHAARRTHCRWARRNERDRPSTSERLGYTQTANSTSKLDTACAKKGDEKRARDYFSASVVHLNWDFLPILSVFTPMGPCSLSPFGIHPSCTLAPPPRPTSTPATTGVGSALRAYRLVLHYFYIDYTRRAAGVHTALNGNIVIFSYTY